MATRNKRRFTEQMLERIRPPKQGRIEIGDEVVPGLVLRITQRGVKTFSVIYKVPGEGGVSPSGRLLAGKQHRVTLGRFPLVGLTDARDQARELLGAVTEGRDPRDERREQNLLRRANTMQAVAERFIEQDAKRTVASWHKIERTLELHVLPTLGETPLQDISRADVHELLDNLVAAGRVGTAREVRKHLSRLFNWSVDREIIGDNPIHGMERRDLAQNEDAGRALDDDELRHIWHAAGKLGYPFGHCYRMLILTGRRLREWADATRSEIDLTSAWHELPRERDKSRRGHILPLSEPAIEIVRGLPVWPGNDYHLFSTRGGDGAIKGFSKAKARLDAEALKVMRKADADAALTPYRVHDFRDTCKTRMAALGISEEVRDAVQNHGKRGMDKTYNKHDYLDEKRSALAAYGAHIMEVVR